MNKLINYINKNIILLSVGLIIILLLMLISYCAKKGDNNELQEARAKIASLETIIDSLQSDIFDVKDAMDKAVTIATENAKEIYGNVQGYPDNELIADMSNKYKKIKELNKKLYTDREKMSASDYQDVIKELATNLQDFVDKSNQIQNETIKNDIKQYQDVIKEKINTITSLKEQNEKLLDELQEEKNQIEDLKETISTLEQDLSESERKNNKPNVIDNSPTSNTENYLPQTNDSLVNVITNQGVIINRQNNEIQELKEKREQDSIFINKIISERKTDSTKMKKALDKALAQLEMALRKKKVTNFSCYYYFNNKKDLKITLDKNTTNTSKFFRSNSPIIVEFELPDSAFEEDTIIQVIAELQDRDGNFLDKGVEKVTKNHPRNKISINYEINKPKKNETSPSFRIKLTNDVGENLLIDKYYKFKLLR